MQKKQQQKWLIPANRVQTSKQTETDEQPKTD